MKVNFSINLRVRNQILVEKTVTNGFFIKIEVIYEKALLLKSNKLKAFPIYRSWFAH